MHQTLAVVILYAFNVHHKFPPAYCTFLCFCNQKQYCFQKWLQVNNKTKVASASEKIGLGINENCNSSCPLDEETRNGARILIKIQ